MASACLGLWPGPSLFPAFVRSATQKMLSGLSPQIRPMKVQKKN